LWYSTSMFVCIRVALRCWTSAATYTVLFLQCWHGFHHMQTNHASVSVLFIHSDIFQDKFCGCRICCLGNNASFVFYLPVMQLCGLRVSSYAWPFTFSCSHLWTTIEVKDAVLYSGFRWRSCVDKVKGDRFYVVGAMRGCLGGRVLAMRPCLSVWLHLVLFFDEY